MYLVRKTAPAAAAVDLTTIKAHLRISHSAEDTWLTAALALATEALDGPNGKLRRALVTQTWYAYCRDFPIHTQWRLPLPPLQSVTAITYVDNGGTTQTVDSATYHVITPDGAAGFVELVDGESWPSDVADRPDAVRVEFVCGYGAASDVPAPIRHAMLLLIAELYENRGDNGAGEPTALGPGVELVTAGAAAARALLSRYLWREMA